MGEQGFQQWQQELLVSLPVFDPGLGPLFNLSIEPVVKQQGILHLKCNLYTIL